MPRLAVRPHPLQYFEKAAPAECRSSEDAGNDVDAEQLSDTGPEWSVAPITYLEMLKCCDISKESPMAQYMLEQGENDKFR